MSSLMQRARELRDPEAARELLPPRLASMVAIAQRARIGGLAAEIAFWGIFILPWVLLGVVSTIGYVQRWFGTDAVSELRDQILDRADDVLTSEAVNETLRPMLDEILSEGRGGLGALGFAAALWSGSRLISTSVVVIRQVHAAAHPRETAEKSWARLRAKSLGAYLLALLALAVGLPLLLAGPRILNALGLGVFGAVAYWLGVALLLIALITGLYKTAVRQSGIRPAVIGAVVALVVWLGGSLGLRLYLGSLGEASPIEAFAAPVALLLWAYVTALAVVLGAVVNAGMCDGDDIEEVK
jgi:membrane protein